MGSYEKNFPVITKLNKLFNDHSSGVIKGEPEFIYSDKWHNIYWPPGEFAMLKLFEERELIKFYNEAKFLLNKFVNKNYLSEYINQAVDFNYQSLKKPFLNKNIILNLDYDIPSDFKKSLLDEKINFKKKSCKYEIQVEKEKTRDFLEWSKEVIWYGHRRASYLYDSRILDGHTITKYK